MKKVLALGASSSKTSINKRFALYTANLLSDCEVNLIDLNDFKAPLFNVDIEKEKGIPESATRLSKAILEADLIIISLAEHNGAYTVAFKNILDWVSRIPDQKTFGNKKMLLLSTSPGSRGGASVIKMANDRFPHMGGEIIGCFSLPNFYDNFSEDKGITNLDLKRSLDNIINSLY